MKVICAVAYWTPMQMFMGSNSGATKLVLLLRADFIFHKKITEPKLCISRRPLQHMIIY
jgi:hypothetical protein